jgi:hypothetical protein
MMAVPPFTHASPKAHLAIAGQAAMQDAYHGKAAKTVSEKRARMSAEGRINGHVVAMTRSEWRSSNWPSLKRSAPGPAPHG